MEATPAQIAEFWFAVRKINLAMERSGDRLFREHLGVGLSLFLVLSVIDARPGQFNQQAVAQTLGITKGTISRQIEIGLAAGYINTQVSPTSRRDNIVSLTPEGTALVRRGDEVLAAEQRRAFSAADGADLVAATDLMVTLIGSMTEPGSIPKAPVSAASTRRLSK